MQQEELKNLAGQLRCPTGEAGAKIGSQMYESNLQMIQSTIGALDLKGKDKVLEIGHGNGAHIDLLFHHEESIHYSGIEISEIMHQEAMIKNEKYIQSRSALFYLYDGKNFPFSENKFDVIMSVNTIYFWKNPSEILSEINRVMKKDGRLVLTFASLGTLKKLSFTQYGFEGYDEKKLNELRTASGFTALNYSYKTEMVKSKSGELIEREYIIASMKK